MVKVKRDQITGAVLVLLGLVVAVLVSQFKMPMTPSYPGPKMLPTIAVVGFITCGAGIFIESTLSKKEEKPFMVKEGWVRMGVTLVILAAYVLAMTYVGYLIATPVVTYIMTTLFAKGKTSTRKGRIIFSVLLTVIIYAIYVFAFGLGLPDGMLFY